MPIEADNSVNQRVKTLIEVLTEGKQNLFVKETGIPASTISSITGERQTSPSYEVIYKIARRFDNVNLEWLIKGVGEMFVVKHAAPETTPVKEKNSDEDFWKGQILLKDRLLLEERERLKRCEEALERSKNNKNVSYGP